MFWWWVAITPKDSLLGVKKYKPLIGRVLRRIYMNELAVNILAVLSITCFPSSIIHPSIFKIGLLFFVLAECRTVYLVVSARADRNILGHTDILLGSDKHCNRCFVAQRVPRNRR